MCQPRGWRDPVGTIATRAIPGVGALAPWPDWEQGPVYASNLGGAPRLVGLSLVPRVGRWYAVPTICLSRPSYEGPILVRGGRLDAPGRLRFGSGVRTRAELRLPVARGHASGVPAHRGRDCKASQYAPSTPRCYARLSVLPPRIAARRHVAPAPLARDGPGDEAAPIVPPTPGALSVLIAVVRLDLAPVVPSNQATPGSCHEAFLLVRGCPLRAAASRRARASLDPRQGRAGVSRLQTKRYPCLLWGQGCLSARTGPTPERVRLFPAARQRRPPARLAAPRTPRCAARRPGEDR
jgi:hypothetical protein